MCIRLDCYLTNSIDEANCFYPPDKYKDRKRHVEFPVESSYRKSTTRNLSFFRPNTMPKLTLLHLLSSTCLFFSQGSLAAPPHHGHPHDTPSMSCAKWILPVPVTADNLIFDVPRVDSNIDAADYSWYEDRWSTPNLTERTRSIFHVDETFGINVKLCVPAAGAGGKGQILQIATHGLGFDQRFVYYAPAFSARA